MEKIFKAIPAERCGFHDVFVKESLGLLSCSCGIAASGCYVIVWDGPGLGLVYDNESDAIRVAEAMNIAWHMAKGDHRVKEV